MRQKRRNVVRSRGPLLASGALALLVFGCSAGAGGIPTPIPSAPAGSASPSGSASIATQIATTAQAVAAVVASDPTFRDFQPRNPALIGQSSWVDAKASGNGFDVTFFKGSGDCPAGCINRQYVKFHVGADGSVERRCEWQEGENARGTPC